jgi:hypothetical protein
MEVERILPTLSATSTHVSREFYADFLGLAAAFGMGWPGDYRSPGNPVVQVSVVSRDKTAPKYSTMPIGVSDVDKACAEPRRRD